MGAKDNWYCLLHDHPTHGCTHASCLSHKKCFGLLASTTAPKKKRKRKRRKTSLTTDIARVNRHDKKVAKDERKRELTDTKSPQSFSYNNDPCIGCGSTIYKNGRVCPKCWV